MSCFNCQNNSQKVGPLRYQEDLFITLNYITNAAP